MIPCNTNECNIYYGNYYESYAATIKTKNLFGTISNVMPKE